MHTASMFDPEITRAHDAAKSLPRWARGSAMIRACAPMLMRRGLQVGAFCVALATLIWLMEWVLLRRYNS